MAASGKRITRLSRAALRADAVKLAALKDRTDAEVEAEAAEDPVAAPITAGESWRGAELIMPEDTVVVSLRVERAVLEHFKTQPGPSPEAAMAAVLRDHVEGRR